MILRFLAGISSGLIFVLSSSLVLDTLFSDKREKWVGIFYGGVGVGIVLVGLLTPFLSIFTWRGPWIGLLIISIILIVPVWSFIHDKEPKPITQNAESLSSSAETPSIFG